jgi:hypothetical protein
MRRHARPRFAQLSCITGIVAICWYSDLSTATLAGAMIGKPGDGGHAMRRTLLVLGLIGLAIGLLWIGQGTGAVAWPRSSFMINEIQWAGYGAVLSAVGLILIWQSQRP